MEVPAGEVAVRLVSEATTTLAAGLLPKLTVMPLTKPVPVMVTEVPPAIGPTWSLAIEEQYYFLWAPLVRFLKRPWPLAIVLCLALIASPAFRVANLAWMTRTHTLIHLDGIALGSLLALGLHTLALERRTWLWIGLASMVLGIAATATSYWDKESASKPAKGGPCA